MENGDKYNRPSWDEYFMEVAKAIGKRGTCDRGRAGSVLAKNKQLLASGYVGSLPGQPHCDEVGHQIKKVTHEDGSESQHCTRTIHSEQNVICQAAKNGIAVEGATIYTKMTPCKICAMLIVNSGIKRVVCEGKYHQNKDTENVFSQSGVQLDYFSNDLVKYDKQ